MLKRTALLLAIFLVGYSYSLIAQVSDAVPHEKVPHRIRAEHLHNVVQVHPKVISGAVPEGEAAFKELQTLGIKTIISVDGAKPDVVMAKKHGLRYVHLPHGYDGVPDIRVQELAKAVLDLEGPIYVHCHHGKHRSPVAASVGCVAAGLIPKSLGLSVLETAGTNPNYHGLYQSARDAEPLEDTLLDQLNVEFYETVKVSPMVEAMASIEQTHDHLKAIAAAGWRSPEEHPDLDPAHEALLMREHFTELLRTKEAQHEPEAFQRLLRESEGAAQSLEDAIRGWQPSRVSEPPAVIQNSHTHISAKCIRCHQDFRDISS